MPVCRSAHHPSLLHITPVAYDKRIRISTRHHLCSGHLSLACLRIRLPPLRFLAATRPRQLAEYKLRNNLRPYWGMVDGAAMRVAGPLAVCTGLGRLSRIEIRIGLRLHTVPLWRLPMSTTRRGSATAVPARLAPQGHGTRP